MVMFLPVDQSTGSFSPLVAVGLVAWPPMGVVCPLDQWPSLPGSMSRAATLPATQLMVAVAVGSVLPSLSPSGTVSLSKSLSSRAVTVSVPTVDEVSPVEPLFEEGL